MIKVFSFLARRPGFTHEEFLRRWSEEAAEARSAAAAIDEHVRRHVHNHPVTDPAIPGFPLADLDGCAETWFDDPETASAALAIPSVRQLAIPAGDFADPACTIVVAAQEAVQFDHGWGEVKFVGLSRRGQAFTSHEEWCRYWVEVHGPLAYGIPEFARYYGKYVHNYVLPSGLGPIPAQPDYDGVVEEWVRSVADFVSCQQEPRYLEVIRPDEQRFVDIKGSRFMMVSEHDLL